MNGCCTQCNMHVHSTVLELSALDCFKPCMMLGTSSTSVALQPHYFNHEWQLQTQFIVRTCIPSAAVSTALDTEASRRPHCGCACTDADVHEYGCAYVFTHHARTTRPHYTHTTRTHDTDRYGYVRINLPVAVVSSSARMVDTAVSGCRLPYWLSWCQSNSCQQARCSASMRAGRECLLHAGRGCLLHVVRAYTRCTHLSCVMHMTLFENEHVRVRVVSVFV